MSDRLEQLLAKIDTLHKATEDKISALKPTDSAPGRVAQSIKSAQSAINGLNDVLSQRQALRAHKVAFARRIVQTASRILNSHGHAG